jgi:hypothetical protein
LELAADRIPQRKNNMKKNMVFGFFVLVIGLSLSGCATRLGAFTVVSTKNIDWSRAAEYTRSNQRVDGEDMLYLIILIPTKGSITIEDAVDKALEKVPGAVALVDAVIRHKYFNMILFAASGYVVEGSVLIDPKLASAGEQIESKYVVVYSTDGKEFIRKEVTEEEYKSYL